MVYDSRAVNAIGMKYMVEEDGEEDSNDASELDKDFLNYTRRVIYNLPIRPTDLKLLMFVYEMTLSRGFFWEKIPSSLWLYGDGREEIIGTRVHYTILCKHRAYLIKKGFLLRDGKWYALNSYGLISIGWAIDIFMREERNDKDRVSNYVDSKIMRYYQDLEDTVDTYYFNRMEETLIVVDKLDPKIADYYNGNKPFILK